MTTRTDVVVDYNDNPRIIEVAAPSTIMNMQDFVDTVRKHEDSFQGMSYRKLIDASGKEDLGGGVQVGITVSEQESQLAFEARLTPAETGTVTSNPGSAINGRDSFVDLAADFITALVSRGSLVINFDDNSLAEVISVTSATQLVTKTLVNGASNVYNITDSYHVFNIIQCNATGGNLVAVDAVQSPIPAVLPTAFTQVILTASSSGTISNLDNLPSLVSDSVWNTIVEPQGGYTAKDALNIGLAALAGEVIVSPDGNTITFSTPDGVITRMVSTTDNKGNRTAIALTPAV